MAKKRRPRPTKRLTEEQLKAAEKQAAEERLLEDPFRPTARDLEIYETYCEGTKSIRALAGDYDLGKSRVHDIIKTVEAWLAKQFIMEIRELRVRSSIRLEHVYQKAMEGFIRSQQDEVTITRVTGGEDGEKVTEQRRGQAGSPAFLNQAREAIRELLEIWGGKAPKTVRHEINEAMRVGGRSPEEAARSRLEYLKKMITPNAN